MKSLQSFVQAWPLIAVVALTASCAVKQPPPPDEQLKGVLPATTSIPTAWTAAPNVSAAVVTDWVQTFSDAQLQALVDEALRNNLDLVAASARIESAAALVVQARSLLYPYIGIAAGAGLVGRDWVKDRSGIIGEFSWELDLWGRVRSQGASAAAGQQATEADLLYARQSLAASVATLWYEAMATERLRQAAQEASVIYTDLLGLVQQRNDVGQVSMQDVALAGADRDRARQRERAFATSEQQILRGLEIVIGRYPAAELALGPDLPPVPPPVPAGLPSELLIRRPDIVSAERRVAEAFHLIQAAEALRWPRLALTGGGGVSSSELLRLADVGASFWSVGLNLIVPLFTGGAISSQIALATAEQKAAVAQYGQTALRAFGEVESTLASEQMLAEQQTYLQSVLTQDTEALRLGRIRYTAGATDLLHVLQMQARQLNTQFDLIGIRNDRLANRVALHLALGGGFVPAVPSPTP